MTKKLTLTVLVFLFTIISIKGQDEPKVIIFKPSSETFEGEENIKSEKNSFKLGLIEAIYGSYAVYYERALNNKFTFDAGFGATFSNLIMELEPRFGFRPIGSTSEYYTYNYGRIISFGAKYYLSEVYEDYYFAFSYFNRNYIWDHFPNGDRGRGLTYKENYRISAPQLLFGYSWLGDAGLVLDTFAGIGFTKFSTDIYSTDTDKIETFEESLPTFRFGMKLGIIF